MDVLLSFSDTATTECIFCCNTDSTTFLCTQRIDSVISQLICSNVFPQNSRYYVIYDSVLFAPPPSLTPRFVLVALAMPTFHISQPLSRPEVSGRGNVWQAAGTHRILSVTRWGRTAGTDLPKHSAAKLPCRPKAQICTEGARVLVMFGKLHQVPMGRAKKKEKKKPNWFALTCTAQRHILYVEFLYAAFEVVKANEFWSSLPFWNMGSETVSFVASLSESCWVL